MIVENRNLFSLYLIFRSCFLGTQFRTNRQPSSITLLFIKTLLSSLFLILQLGGLCLYPCLTGKLTSDIRFSVCKGQGWTQGFFIGGVQMVSITQKTIRKYMLCARLQLRMIYHSVNDTGILGKRKSKCSYQESILRPSDYWFRRSTAELQETRGS